VSVSYVNTVFEKCKKTRGEEGATACERIVIWYLTTRNASLKKIAVFFIFQQMVKIC